MLFPLASNEMLTIECQPCLMLNHGVSDVASGCLKTIIYRAQNENISNTVSFYFCTHQIISFNLKKIGFDSFPSSFFLINFVDFEINSYKLFFNITIWSLNHFKLLWIHSSKSWVFMQFTVFIYICKFLFINFCL